MNEVKIHILQCGTIRLPLGAAIGGTVGFSGLLKYIAEPDKKRVDMPCFVYLIEHPKHGLIMVDTGLPRAISPEGVFDAKAAGTLLPKHLVSLFRPRVEKGMSAKEQLDAMGIKPEDIDLLILTHLDADHVCALHDFSRAKRILFSEDEYFWSCRKVYAMRQPQGLWLDVPAEHFWYRGSSIGPNRWCYDIFGDESIQLVSCPGHTDGLCSVYIINGKNKVLLTSDAAFCRDNWEKLIVPGFGFDANLQLKCLEYIRSFSEDPFCCGIFSSHDRDVVPHTIVI